MLDVLVVRHESSQGTDGMDESGKGPREVARAGRDRISIQYPTKRSLPLEEQIDTFIHHETRYTGDVAVYPRIGHRLWGRWA